MWRSRGCGWGVGEFRKLHQDVEGQRMWLGSRIVQEAPPGCGGAEDVAGSMCGDVEWDDMVDASKYLKGKKAPGHQME